MTRAGHVRRTTGIVHEESWEPLHSKMYVPMTPGPSTSLSRVQCVSPSPSPSLCLDVRDLGQTVVGSKGVIERTRCLPATRGFRSGDTGLRDVMTLTFERVT